MVVEKTLAKAVLFCNVSGLQASGLLFLYFCFLDFNTCISSVVVRVCEPDFDAGTLQKKKKTPAVACVLPPP